MRCLIIIIICLLATIPCSARIITVDDDGPADFSNIQAAINDSNDGDTIIVQPGTYTGDGNRDIDFGGRAITVRSTDSNDTSIVAETVIDCNGTRLDKHRGFHFHNGEDNNSVLEGLTIKNGYVCDEFDGNGFLENGGGILVENSKPTIRNCIISNNFAEYHGVGELLFSGGHGGGICCYTNGNAIIINCIIISNTADRSGGGISCYESSPTISHCNFFQNRATDLGGGISFAEGSPTISHCRFISNDADGTFFGGGGISCLHHSSAKILNCVFRGNYSGRHGGGFLAFGCSGFTIPELINCTFHDNYAAESGGAVVARVGYSVRPTLRNCIVWDNEPDDSGVAIFQQGRCGYPAIYVDFSVLQNNWEQQLDGDCINVTNSMIADPCFADANSGDYHLKSQAGRWEPNSQSWAQDDVTSPCIDTGDLVSPIGNEPFPNGGRINMGAFGGTAEASKSYFGEPVCEIIVAGDINGDCKVNFLDFRIMGLNWLQDYSKSQY
jgi:parallel beta-helix repeat protein